MTLGGSGILVLVPDEGPAAALPVLCEVVLSGVLGKLVLWLALLSVPIWDVSLPEDL